jgi:hypothetical protein
MKKSILFTSIFTLAITEAVFAENIKDNEGNSLVSHEKYYIKTASDSFIYPNLNDSYIIKSNNTLENQNAYVNAEINAENQTQNKKQLHISDNLEITFFNKKENVSLGKLMNRAQTQFLVIENNKEIKPTLFNLIKTNDNNNTYYLVNKENGYYLSCENFLNPQLCFIVEKSAATEQSLTKIKFVLVTPKVPNTENPVKEPNDIEKISSELAKLEKRIREELARWDSQFKELTTEEQLQHFRDKVDAFKRENDKALVKFDAEKIQPLFNYLNNESNKIISLIDEKIKADRTAQLLREEADRTAQRIREEADRAAQQAREEADRTAQRIREEADRIAKQFEEAKNKFRKWF